MSDFNPVTGELVETAPEAAGPQVSVLAPDGTFKQVEQWKVPNLVQSGYQLDTPELRQQIADKAKYGEGIGNEALATAAGAARTLSFGASDLAMTHLAGPGGAPLVRPETLEKLKEYNPDATTAGEIGGLLVPVAGEIGLAAKGVKAVGAGARALRVAEGLDAGARAAGLGVGAVAKGGAVVENIAKTLLKGMPGQVVGAAARAAVETEAYNIAHNISETTLGDQDLTAERLLAHSGDALALGGGIGAAIPLGGALLRKSVERAKSALDGLGGYIQDRLPELAKPATEAFAKASAKVSGKSEAEIAGNLAAPFTKEGAAAREKLVTGVTSEERDALTRDFQKQFTEAFDSTQSLMKKAMKDYRPKETALLTEGVPIGPASDGAASILNAFKQTVAEMRGEPELYAGSVVRKLEKISEGFERKLVDVGPDSTSKLFTMMDDLKRAVDPVAKFGKTLSLAEQDAVRKAQELRGLIKSHLEDPSLYGDAAARQAAMNDAVHTMITLTGTDKSRGPLQKYFLDRQIMKGGRVELVADPTKIGTYLNKIGAARDQRHTAALEQWFGAAQTLADQIGQTAENIGVKDLNQAGLKSLVEKAQAAKQVAADRLEQAAKERAGGPFNMPSAISHTGGLATVGAVLGGAPGAAVGGALQAGINVLKDPHSAVKALSVLEGITLKTASKVSKAIDGFISGGDRAAAKVYAASKPLVGEAVTEGMHRSFADDAPEFKSRHEAYANRLDRLSTMVTQPVQTASALAEPLQHLRQIAPGLIDNVLVKQSQIAQYLYQQAPKDPLAAKELSPTQSKWRPSGVELAAYNRKAEAAANPLVILDKLQKGTLDVETVQTVKTLYPKMYGEIVNEIMTRSAELQRDLPYRDQISLGIMFGVPLNPAMSMTADIQKMYAAKPEEQPKGQGDPAASKIAGEAKTNVQRLDSK